LRRGCNNLRPVAADQPAVHSQPCPCCGGPIIIIERFERGATPRRPSPRPQPVKRNASRGCFKARIAEPAARPTSVHPAVSFLADFRTPPPGVCSAAWGGPPAENLHIIRLRHYPRVATVHNPKSLAGPGSVVRPSAPSTTAFHGTGDHPCGKG
jgi:hypothetical protein